MPILGNQTWGHVICRFFCRDFKDSKLIDVHRIHLGVGIGVVYNMKSSALQDAVGEGKLAVDALEAAGLLLSFQDCPQVWQI